MEVGSGPVKPLRVLLVERDPDVSEVFIALMTYLGHEAKAVASPPEALIWAKDLVPDIIYTCIVFQDMHGFELAARIRSMPELNATSLVLFTGTYYPGIEEIAKLSGFDNYLLKPVAVERLIESLDAHRNNLAKLRSASTKLP